MKTPLKTRTIFGLSFVFIGAVALITSVFLDYPHCTLFRNPGINCTEGKITLAMGVVLLVLWLLVILLFLLNKRAKYIVYCLSLFSVLTFIFSAYAFFKLSNLPSMVITGLGLGVGILGSIMAVTGSLLLIGVARRLCHS